MSIKNSKYATMMSYGKSPEEIYLEKLKIQEEYHEYKKEMKRRIRLIEMALKVTAMLSEIPIIIAISVGLALWYPDQYEGAQFDYIIISMMLMGLPWFITACLMDTLNKGLHPLDVFITIFHEDNDYEDDEYYDEYIDAEPEKERGA